jgi:hypothetical protein
VGTGIGPRGQTQVSSLEFRGFRVSGLGLSLIITRGRKKRKKSAGRNGFDLHRQSWTFNFSMAWCKRVLPCAHEVYLKGLPPCFPTSTHETHLERGHCMHFGEW